MTGHIHMLIRIHQPAPGGGRPYRWLCINCGAKLKISSGVILSRCLQSSVVEHMLLGELSPEKEQEFVQHCEGCKGCAAALKVGRAFIAAVKRSGGEQ